MIGVIADTAALLIGASIGVLAHKFIPASWEDIVLKGLGLCSIYIGISGALEGQNTMILIISIAVGAMIGEGFQLEQRFNRFAERIEHKFDSKGGKSNFAQGFVTASLIVCVGAMSIVGSLDAGLRGDNTLLFTKSVLDFVGGIMFGSALGIGVIFSAVTVFVFQGSIVLLAGFVSPILTDSVITEMACAGSLVILAMGINQAVGTKLKIMNYMPAVFLPIIFCPLAEWLSGLL